MAFYEQISKYYDYIFPVGTEQLKFIIESAGAPPKRILDVACGSGGYSAALAEEGYELTSVDNDSEMIRLAKEKAANKGLDTYALQCDMLQLESCLETRFDCIFCIGNSIVHLENHLAIENTLEQMHALLEEGGRLVLQIINYDRIIKYNIKELPAIENEEIGLRFVRNYEYNKDRNVIYFNTELTISNEEKYENSIELLPLLRAQMEDLLKRAGFGRYQFYGDFKRSAYDDNAYMLVVEAKK
ncbi:MAG: methyltransferase domain-containing protein [Clostridia bacterium]|nr:methyltransferase domain-containing protein [Clostridia bacterium]